MNGVPIKIIFKNAVYENFAAKFPRSQCNEGQKSFFFIAIEFLSDVA